MPIYKKPELLSPAGDLEKLKTAVLFGADAVYLGGQNFSLRSRAKNFGEEDMREGIAFAHEKGVKAYVAANIFAKNADFDDMADYLRMVEKYGADAVIISDAGVFALAREVTPDLDIHVSTQANTTNYKAVEFWKNLGAKRVILARELSLTEIADIAVKTNGIELEAFVHGAMCVSYSGRCILSNALTGRSGNRGECAHPCRYEYALMERKRDGEYFPIEEDSRGAYVMNSKDLRMIEHLPELYRAGLVSLKIEGRMKTPFYVGAVTSAYRKAIDDLFEDESKYKNNIVAYIERINMASSRDFCTGFYFGKPDETAHIYHGESYIRPYDFAGMVISYENGYAVIEQRNKFSVGEEVTFLTQDGQSFTRKIAEIKTEAGETVEAAPHPKQRLVIKTDLSLKPFDMMIKRSN